MVFIVLGDAKVFEKIKEVVYSDLWKERRAAILEAKRLVLQKYNTFAWRAAFISNVHDKPLPPQTMRIGRSGVRL
ncbi:hypothetical protein [Mesorhizobium carmichaelinearum]|uniref:hypothetical protein n=1 Tax=Mesorhizobium carmichaelinearum TaxID=1208188 RepID=UPI000BA36FDF|nr:hypothetical protein [Mesorhizobium carmichaelinearum]